MKSMLLVEAPSSNPSWNPPDPRGGVLNEMAYQEYCAVVPHTISLPPGTILEDPKAWLHCFPVPVPELQNSGQLDRRDEIDGTPYLVRAIPADEQCLRVVQFKLRGLLPEAKPIYDRFQKRVPELLKQHGLSDPLTPPAPEPTPPQPEPI